MIIRDKKKFVRGILLIVAISISLVFIMTGKTFSHQEMKYKTVSVVFGDTLWDIAENEQKNNRYYKGNDIRDIIQNIKEINNLKSSELKANQILEIPTY